MDVSDRPFLRPAVQAQHLLDAWPEASAVIEHDGDISAVNSGWTRFARENGGDPNRVGVGTNYLYVCARSVEQGDSDAARALDGIRRVLDGRSASVRVEYDCSSPAIFRQFVLRITAVDGRRALASHLDVTRRTRAERDAAMTLPSADEYSTAFSAVGPLAELSARERVVVVLLLRGHRVPAIAEELFVSPSTVRSQLSSAFAKLGVSSQPELIELIRNELRGASCAAQRGAYSSSAMLSGSRNSRM